MSNITNLDAIDDAESFEFTLGANNYSFRYPTTEEIQKLASFKNDEKVMDYIYEFVTTSSEAAPSIKDALAKSSIKKFIAFQKMVKHELGIEEIQAA